jgi:hypothetical protein
MKTTIQVNENFGGGRPWQFDFEPSVSKGGTMPKAIEVGRKLTPSEIGRKGGIATAKKYKMRNIPRDYITIGLSREDVAWLFAGLVLIIVVLIFTSK